jgi:hypothetical protein
MDFWDRLQWKVHPVLIWIFRGGLVLWGVLIAQELREVRQDPERMMTLLVIGGGGLYLTWRAIRTLEASRVHRYRRSAKAAVRRDPDLRLAGTRKDLLPYVLGSDLNRTRFEPWASRLYDLFERLIEALFNGAAPRDHWRQVVVRVLSLLEAGRDRWIRWLDRSEDGPDPPGAMRDEEVLHILHGVIVLLSALYRFHILRWGNPAAPFKRGFVVRLRRQWLPICSMEPNVQTFPPALPEEVSGRVSAAERERLWNLFYLGVLKGEPRAMTELVEALSRPP